MVTGNNAIRAVVVAEGVLGRLALGEAPAPTPRPTEAVVRVAAISLGRSDLRKVQDAPVGTRLGGDLAGVVERAAADGSGPAAGVRVAGLGFAGGWAEACAVPTSALAPLPDGVGFAQGAALPNSGLTAKHAIDLGGPLLGKTVLVTGATGGVGHFAVQLARLAGARVIGQVRTHERVALVRGAGADDVIVGDDVADHGPYDLIVDGVGGHVLADALRFLDPDGVAVAYGIAGGDPVLSLDLRHFVGGNLYRLRMRNIYRHQPPAEGLQTLIGLTAAHRLHPHVAREAKWADVGEIAQNVIDRAFDGKAILILN
jgi:NADPH:quinone reductase